MYGIHARDVSQGGRQEAKYLPRQIRAEMLGMGDIVIKCCQNMSEDSRGANRVFNVQLHKAMNIISSCLEFLIFITKM